MSMNSEWERVQSLYQTILDSGPAATERYYASLRSKGIFPTPSEGGDLYAPNPVLVPGFIVERMTDDLNRFVQYRKEHSNATDFFHSAPDSVRDQIGSIEIATNLWEELQTEPPMAQLDAFLERAEDGWLPKYLEWQTAGSYPTLARWVLDCARSAWPALQAASPVATRGWDMRRLEKQLREIYTRGIESDPRQGVVIDYRPMSQVTRREFLAIQEITGGEIRGIGIIDPREVFYLDGKPHYRRNEISIPIRLAYSRLVHGELLNHLLPECSSEEHSTMHRFFCDTNIHWVSHPLHFYFGTKAHFPDFYAADLSPFLPPTWSLTSGKIAELRDKSDRLPGFVLKPTTGHGGQQVVADPEVGRLEPGALLQERIQAAACHPTRFGPRIPEIRIMGIPDGNRLVAAGLFTRVMAPDQFLSNAGAIAARAIPGTGEGYGFTVY